MNLRCSKGIFFATPVSVSLFFIIKPDRSGTVTGYFHIPGVFIFVNKYSIEIRGTTLIFKSTHFKPHSIMGIPLG